MIVLPPPCPLLEGKPCQQEPCLDVQKLIKVTKEINLLPPKGHGVLTRVRTNKFGVVTCVKCKSIMPRLSIDRVHAMLDQIKVVLPKEKRKAPSTLVENDEKLPR